VIVTSKNSYFNSFSKWGKIIFDVPQGSIVGPLLFLIYINDPTKIVGNNSKPVLFANENTSNMKFLGLVITNSLSWKNRITHLTSKLCKACYVLRCIWIFMSQDTLKSVSYSYFHSLISSGIIFWGNSSVFLSFDFKRGQLESLLGQDQGIPVEDCLRYWGYYLYGLLYIQCPSLFVVNNKNLFHVNSEIHGFNTRQNFNLHQVISDVKWMEFEVRRVSSISRNRGWNYVSEVRWRNFEVRENQVYTGRR
jgi:hypothetical protein